MIGWPLATACAAPAPDDGPYFRTITVAPGYDGGLPWSISANGGMVVGQAGVSDKFFVWHAFRWSAEEGMEILGSLWGDLNSEAWAASPSGSVIVGTGEIGGGAGEAFRWTAHDGMMALGVLPGGEHFSVARSLSGDGSVVTGFSSVSVVSHAFRWTQQTGMVDMGTLPGGMVSLAFGISTDGFVIVGRADKQAFRWTQEQGMVGLGDLPGGAFDSRATAVSADGSVVVGWGHSGAGREAFRWTESDGIVGLGFLKTTYSKAYAVSADGSVVVGEGIAANARHRPFIWTADRGMRNLQDIIRAELGLDLDNFDELVSATGVSADGRTIVGWGYNRDGRAEGWIAFLGPICRADFNRDDVVDTLDLVAYLNAWVEESVFADWNYDALIDTRDVIAFLNDWVKGCP